jgi:GTP-binding protein EngB required for normal cell division
MKTYILVGGIGSGKSTIGNYLLNRYAFSCGYDKNGVTKKIQIETSRENVQIIDTPGFNEDFVQYIKQILNLQYFLKQFSKIDAIILVKKFNLNDGLHLTQLEQNLIDLIKQNGLIKSLMFIFNDQAQNSSVDRETFRKKLNNYELYRSLNAKCMLWTNNELQLKEFLTNDKEKEFESIDTNKITNFLRQIEAQINSRELNKSLKREENQNLILASAKQDLVDMILKVYYKNESNLVLDLNANLNPSISFEKIIFIIEASESNCLEKFRKQVKALKLSNTEKYKKIKIFYIYSTEDELKESNVFSFYLACSITSFRFKFDDEILDYYKETFVLEKKSALVEKIAQLYPAKEKTIQKIEPERKREVYLITGSASEDNIKLLLKKKFNLENYNSSTKDYSLSDDFIRVLVDCNLFKQGFSLSEFRSKCNEIKSDLKEIVCFENLNPRPDTLVDDMNILKRVFSSKELRDKMVICFTSNQTIKLSEVQSYAKNFDFLFIDVLQMSGSLENEKEEFINKSIKTLDALELVSLNKTKPKSNQEEKEDEYVGAKGKNYYANRGYLNQFEETGSQEKNKDRSHFVETNDARCFIL